jgi:hypothetical protein
MARRKVIILIGRWMMPFVRLHFESAYGRVMNKPVKWK